MHNLIYLQDPHGFIRVHLHIIFFYIYRLFLYYFYQDNNKPNSILITYSYRLNRFGALARQTNSICFLLVFKRQPDLYSKEQLWYI